MFAVGLLFIIYSAINVYSSSDVESNSAIRPDIDLNDLSTILPKLSTSISNDDVPVSASTLETPQSTMSTTKGSVLILFIMLNLMLFLFEYVFFAHVIERGDAKIINNRKSNVSLTLWK